MGMKRRGTGRRQVLNLNDKQDSPRRTWQSKLLTFCLGSACFKCNIKLVKLTDQCFKFPRA